MDSISGNPKAASSFSLGPLQLGVWNSPVGHQDLHPGSRHLNRPEHIFLGYCLRPGTLTQASANAPLLNTSYHERACMPAVEGEGAATAVTYKPSAVRSRHSHNYLTCHFSPGQLKDTWSLPRVSCFPSSPDPSEHNIQFIISWQLEGLRTRDSIKVLQREDRDGAPAGPRYRRWWGCKQPCFEISSHDISGSQVCNKVASPTPQPSWFSVSNMIKMRWNGVARRGCCQPGAAGPPLLPKLLSKPLRETSRDSGAPATCWAPGALPWQSRLPGPQRAFPHMHTVGSQTRRLTSGI